MDKNFKIIQFLGDPIEVLPRLLNILYSKFGGQENEKGFKVLDKHVRLIQGDGVNMTSIKEITNILEQNGFATDNLVFGSGGKSRDFDFQSLSSIFRWPSTKIRS